ncbi:MAG: site-2 protease family protein [Clostridiales bacterium]|nr:site-2 protease family protein [Clostridiales bacterium]
MLSRLQNPLLILFSLPAILVGLIIHELSHALMADSLGDPTPRMDGRITLNPRAHLDFVGTLMLVFFGFGWARPVRTNPSNFSDRRFGFLWVSLAGPLSNLMIAFVSMGALLIARYRFNVGEGLFMSLMEPMVTINLVLFILNLLPIPPLDGYNVLRTLLPVRNRSTLWKLERYGFVLLIALSFIGVLGMVLSVGVSFFWNIFERFYGFIL